MLNVIHAWVLEQATVEPELSQAREKAKKRLTSLFAGENVVDADPALGTHPGIIYDADGKPRPAPMAYDETLSDDLPARRPLVVRPLPPETVPTDDYDNPFPGLSRPLG